MFTGPCGLIELTDTEIGFSGLGWMTSGSPGLRTNLQTHTFFSGTVELVEVEDGEVEVVVEASVVVEAGIVVVVV